MPPGQQTVPVGAKPVDHSKITSNDPTLGSDAPVWTTQNGKKIGLYAQEGGCGKVRADLASQSQTEIKIVLVETVPSPEKKMACTLDLRYPPVEVALDAPHNDRRIVVDRRTETG
ncbi:hypothetical protein D5S17_03065 [Pseudonocardiaceae bacterium YIM PH 21723]|nr:hypothetical protein D5S17_03065 [Pseudonocardiaceae bacterium YIM PH 21723]